MIRTPGNHVPNVKNRSSKHLMCLTRLRPIVRCVNNEILSKWAAGNVAGASKELARRKAKHNKTAN